VRRTFRIVVDSERQGAFTVELESARDVLVQAVSHPSVPYDVFLAAIKERVENLQVLLRGQSLAAFKGMAVFTERYGLDQSLTHAELEEVCITLLSAWDLVLWAAVQAEFGDAGQSRKDWKELLKEFHRAIQPSATVRQHC
jgi:hypothetical protein